MGCRSVIGQGVLLKRAVDEARERVRLPESADGQWHIISTSLSSLFNFFQHVPQLESTSSGD